MVTNTSRCEDEDDCEVCNDEICNDCDRPYGRERLDDDCASCRQWAEDNHTTEATYVMCVLCGPEGHESADPNEHRAPIGKVTP
jgi:hypothetical protein